ncbi:PilZ domain-containing protein [Formivibrio citricus]|uniref:Flagellar brake protein YcgR n=1 Tax=Formivibrio citricus TaxID=83765 RepID=A0A1I4XQJ4_9NEIS|nr:flagellar brake protein [Formivibrio citricus]SFN27539.1 PilZ domain-containing protein [Formivibrio citricus]
MTDHATLAPLSLENTAPYLIDTEAQIQHLLVRLARRPELICLYPPKKREPFALSALLQVTDTNLFFDVSPDEHINKVLEQGSKLVCISSLDRVHIQFDAPKPVRIEHQGRPAFRTGRPDFILHVQRRDYYRLDIPARQPVICRIPLGQTDTCLDVAIIDISQGGIALPGPLPMELVPGMQLHGCRLELPETGCLEVDLLVCSLQENRARAGTRIGCRFMNLSGGEQTLIQRYINRIERSRMARE